ncbi:MAG TPA: SgcJ/EcaC family oxidoreductase [Gammaproteobacteria bacterium]|nr:SgcJ/EcaC family oxidoreductase [Gammaproteobacteria bacterium]
MAKTLFRSLVLIQSTIQGTSMKTSHLLSVSILTAVATATATASAATHKLPTHAQIAKLFKTWNSALQTGNPETVANLYCAKGAVLLPTVSNQVRTTHKGIVDYFTYFLKSKPVGHIDREYIRVLGPNTAINSGIYTFNLIQNGKSTSVQARYTYVYEKQHGKWCIMDHHSSAMPE